MMWLLCFPCVRYIPGIQWMFLVLMPLLASLCGPDVVVRLSLILMLHTFIADILPVINQIPFLSTALLVVLVALPVNLFPSMLVWVYTQVILSSEPLLMMLEAIAVVHFVMQTSKQLVSYIDDRPVVVKTTVLGITVISYVASFSLGLILFLTGSHSIKWILASIAVMSLVLLIVTLVKDEGIISDCALMSFYLTWCLWVMQQENSLSSHPLKPPATWERSKSLHSSVAQILYGFLHLKLASISSSLLFMWSLLSPTTVVMLVMRSFVILQARSIASRIPLPFSKEEEDSWSIETDSEDEDAISSYCCSTHNKKETTSTSSLPLKLTLFFVYTQLVVYNIESSVNPMNTMLFNIDVRNWVLLGDVRLFRVMQMTLCGIFYLWSLIMSHTPMEDADWY
ncbi:uncharacterized protein [Apostichopus japonicus]|uniref:uncharacterized protein isoform X2 n=1 Tax=Stichopus japonicus TaxID=307972 RepID=UPI003AB5F484